MTGIATGHRVLNNQTQSIMAMMQDVTAAQTIGGLINLFNYFDPVRPDGTDSTQFTFDTEIVTPSNGTGHSISIPFDVRFSVTITDNEKRTAETMMLHALCDPSAVYLSQWMIYFIRRSLHPSEHSENISTMHPYL